MAFSFANRKAKYNNKKAELDGITFDSTKEMKRYIVLKKAQEEGIISDLMLQVKFELIPSQRDGDGKVTERAVCYIADFVYFDRRTNETVAEDVKGYRDPSSAVYKVFAIKRKMMLFFHGITVREV